MRMDAVAAGFQEYWGILRNRPHIKDDEKLLSNLQQSLEITRELAALHNPCPDQDCIPHVIEAILGCSRHAKRGKDAYEDAVLLLRKRKEAASLLAELFDIGPPAAELYRNKVPADRALFVQAKEVFGWIRPWLDREGAAHLKKLRQHYPLGRKHDAKKNFGAMLARQLTELTGGPQYRFVAVTTDIVFPSASNESTTADAIRLAHGRYEALRKRQDDSRRKIV